MSNGTLASQDKESIRKIITDDPDAKIMVKFAEETGNRLFKDGLTRSQIRNIFSEARKIEAGWSNDAVGAARQLTLLKPKLAYQVGKAPRPEQIKHFANVLTEAITEVEGSQDKEKAFEKFMELFEAILAYHRSSGGK